MSLGHLPIGASHGGRGPLKNWPPRGWGCEQTSTMPQALSTAFGDGRP